jgi:hypothetical protein
MVGGYHRLDASSPLNRHVLCCYSIVSILKLDDCFCGVQLKLPTVDERHISYNSVSQ